MLQEGKAPREHTEDTMEACDDDGDHTVWTQSTNDSTIFQLIPAQRITRKNYTAVIQNELSAPSDSQSRPIRGFRAYDSSALQLPSIGFTRT